MTTTDTALTEQIKHALWDALPDDGMTDAEEQETYRIAEGWLARDAVAVLPIIRKAERDAARAALDGLTDEMIGADSAPAYLAPRLPRSFAESAALVRWYRDTHYPEETP